MTKITGFTIHTTGEGIRAAFMYSVIDDEGRMVSRDKRAEVVLLDADAIASAQSLYTFLETKIPE